MFALRCWTPKCVFLPKGFMCHVDNLLVLLEFCFPTVLNYCELRVHEKRLLCVQNVLAQLVKCVHSACQTH